MLQTASLSLLVSPLVSPSSSISTFFLSSLLLLDPRASMVSVCVPGRKKDNKHDTNISEYQCEIFHTALY